MMRFREMGSPSLEKVFLIVTMGGSRIWVVMVRMASLLGGGGGRLAQRGATKKKEDTLDGCPMLSSRWATGVEGAKKTKQSSAIVYREGWQRSERGAIS